MIVGDGLGDPAGEQAAAATTRAARAVAIRRVIGPLTPRLAR
jgi:hypothetical protein